MSWHFSCATVNLPTETFLDGLATLGRKQENNEHADNGYERHLMRQTFINSHLYVNDPLEIVCSCWQWHFTSITVKLSRRKINWNRSQIWLEIKNRSQIWPMTDGFTSISDFLPFHLQLSLHMHIAHSHCHCLHWDNSTIYHFFSSFKWMLQSVPSRDIQWLYWDKGHLLYKLVLGGYQWCWNWVHALYCN